MGVYKKTLRADLEWASYLVWDSLWNVAEVDRKSEVEVLWQIKFKKCANKLSPVKGLGLRYKMAFVVDLSFYGMFFKAEIATV